MPTRLVLCLDGTWNNADAPGPRTNIARLRDIVVRGNPTTGVPASGGDGIVRLDMAQRVYYDAGVGTRHPIDRIVGGATGQGLERNIRQAYKYICKRYRPRDEVYIFGFSRGAFTARSLVGYIMTCGLLTPEGCTSENEQRAWDYYRTEPNDRSFGDQSAIQAFAHPSERVRIKCVGVFDTVGALGIPIQAARWLQREKLDYHNTRLSERLDFAFHALAIDERRRPFMASLWEHPFNPLNPDKQPHVEQAWFPGSHSDVGGGYSEDIASSIALDWMLKRIKAVGLGLKVNSAVARPDAMQQRALTTYFAGNPQQQAITSLYPGTGHAYITELNRDIAALSAFLDHSASVPDSDFIDNYSFDDERELNAYLNLHQVPTKVFKGLAVVARTGRRMTLTARDVSGRIEPVRQTVKNLDATMKSLPERISNLEQDQLMFGVHKAFNDVEQELEDLEDKTPEPSKTNDALRQKAALMLRAKRLFRSNARLHDSRRRVLSIWSLMRPKHRSINKTDLQLSRFHNVSEEYLPVGEQVHLSALERMLEKTEYEPKSLLAALPYIPDLFADAGITLGIDEADSKSLQTRQPYLPVAGWEGELIDAAVFDALCATTVVVERVRKAQRIMHLGTLLMQEDAVLARACQKVLTKMTTPTG